MERDSFLYKARRTGQVIAHKFIPDTVMSKLYFTSTGTKYIMDKIFWKKICR